MSELKVDKVSPRSGNYVALNTVGMKNIVINGDMSIAQRSTSVASITASGYYTLDRWQTAITTLGTWTQSQDTDVPTGYGFATSLKMDCTTADATPSANDVLFIAQKFEGQNLQYLKKGTANAESLTLSFWVKSNKTGTYIVGILDSDNTRNIAENGYSSHELYTKSWKRQTCSCKCCCTFVRIWYDMGT
jgi:phage-related tail fiber protein